MEKLDWADMTPQTESLTSRVEVSIGHSPLAFFYELFTPSIRLNGQLQRRPWGTHSLELPPGDHEISISYPWFLSPECGKNTVNINLKPGETKKVIYRAGLIRYLPGKISVE
jgi:hypothetical protein